MTSIDIIDSYTKDIKDYLYKGLVAGQANGSYGEDLLSHFEMMADYFKETKKIENEIGIDLITLFKALLEGAWFKEGKPASFIVFDSKPFLRTDIKPKPFAIDFVRSAEPHYLKDYGKTWALTKGELE